MSDGVQITPRGFRQIVSLCITGEAGEHFLDPRQGSLLALADRVARCCMEEAEAGGEMTDAVYERVVRRLAPHFCESDSERSSA